jgi:hypothetical protein
MRGSGIDVGVGAPAGLVCGTARYEVKPTLVDRVFAMPQMLKTCTHCNETVREEARRCQFCSYRFDVATATWPAKLNVAGALALGGAAALVLTSMVAAMSMLVFASTLVTIGAFGRRASRKKQFARVKRGQTQVAQVVVRLVRPHNLYNL